MHAENLWLATNPIPMESRAPPNCECGVEAKRGTCGPSSKYSGQDFYGCPNWQDPDRKCRYWILVDKYQAGEDWTLPPWYNKKNGGTKRFRAGAPPTQVAVPDFSKYKEILDVMKQQQAEIAALKAEITDLRNANNDLNRRVEALEVKVP